MTGAGVRGARLFIGAGVRGVLLQAPDMLSPSREEPRARSSTVSEGQLQGDHNAVQEVAALELLFPPYALLHWCCYIGAPSLCTHTNPVTLCFHIATLTLLPMFSLLIVSL